MFDGLLPFAPGPPAWLAGCSGLWSLSTVCRRSAPRQPHPRTQPRGRTRRAATNLRRRATTRTSCTPGK